MKSNDTAMNIALIGGAGVAAFFLLKRFGGQAANAVNPLNNDNVFARGSDAVVSELAGTDTSIGSLLFDFIDRLSGNAPYDPNAPAADIPSNVPENNFNDRNVDPDFVGPLFILG